MSIFNGRRLTNEAFKLDIERMRRGGDRRYRLTGRAGGAARTDGGPAGPYGRLFDPADA
jgi:hypothetical protein